jgi:phosphoglycolate phosphatase
MDSFMGKTMEEIGEMLFPNKDAVFQKEIMDACGDEEVVYLREHGAILFPQLRETIQALKECYDLYIVSNCQDGYVPAFMHAHGVEKYIRDIEMSGRTGLDKGRNIRLLMERNGITEAVYVGDTEGDEKATRFVGIPFIWAAYGFGKAVAPDDMIEDITDLPACLGRLWG